MPTSTAIPEIAAAILSEAGGQPAYQRAINGSVRGLWNGVYSPEYFSDNMFLAIRKYLREGWLEGAASVGVAANELSAEETAALESMIANELGFVSGFRDAIIAGNKANGGALAPLLGRAILWANRYAEAVDRGRVMAAGDEKLEWVFGKTEKHCRDCGRLAGKVKRASVWAQYALAPQSPRLACKGYKCDCKRIPTRKPITPGPLPAPTNP